MKRNNRKSPFFIKYDKRGRPSKETKKKKLYAFFKNQTKITSFFTKKTCSICSKSCLDYNSIKLDCNHYIHNHCLSLYFDGSHHIDIFCPSCSSLIGTNIDIGFESTVDISIKNISRLLYLFWSKCFSWLKIFCLKKWKLIKLQSKYYEGVSDLHFFGTNTRNKTIREKVEN
jgi:hypothetical protein